MKILFAASEAVPYCKTGGLADVAGALPEALAAKGTTVLRVLPLYRTIRKDTHKLVKTRLTIRVPVGKEIETGVLWTSPANKNIQTVFIDNFRFYDRDGLYGHPPGTDFPDNDRRFTFFSRGVLEAAKAFKFKPDVVHLHDWQTALGASFLKTFYKTDPFLSKTAAVFTIHNMAYQGLFPAVAFGVTGLPPSEFSIDGLEYYGQMNTMKGGLAYADALSTVSPTYAKEIKARNDRGFGLEGLLASRSKRLVGILNGLDVKTWDPAKDPYLESPFDVKRLKDRERCKLDLQRQVGLAAQADVALFGFVGRLDRHKGIEILLSVAPSFLNRGCQLAILGIGNPDYQSALINLRTRFPRQVALENNFAEPLAHKIYAGSDFFLMPSLFEPCGLGQMIAMRYGALPIVTPTGGLLDSVKPISSTSGNGFVAKEVSAASYEAAISAALAFSANEKKWRAAQIRAMKTDFSWDKSVTKYLALYKNAQRWRRQPA